MTNNTPEFKQGDARGTVHPFKPETTITDKRGFGQRWQVTPRTVDNWIAQGMPHFCLGTRRVRISIEEADRWMREQFATRRRKAHRANSEGEGR